MFRLDEDRVVDATLSGGLARYINHSCNPNCVTEIVEVDREFRIIIFAKRRINRGEEVSVQGEVIVGIGKLFVENCFILNETFALSCFPSTVILRLQVQH